jgi:hypothetical protein
MERQTNESSPGEGGGEHPVERLRWTLAANERTLWLAVGAALVLDFALTVYGFHLGFVEQNQLARALLSSYGLAGILGLKLAALVLAVALRRVLPTGYRALVPLALAIPWWIGVVANAVQISALLV